jgi:hypothetical protein
VVLFNDPHALDGECGLPDGVRHVYDLGVANAGRIETACVFEME